MEKNAETDVSNNPEIIVRENSIIVSYIYQTTCRQRSQPFIIYPEFYIIPFSTKVTASSPAIL